MKCSELVSILLKFPQELPVLIRESEFLEYGISKRQIKQLIDGGFAYLAIDLTYKEYKET